MIKNTNWLIFNAENKTLGRFASKIAVILMGKNKINYAPNKVIGDKIIIINSKKIKISGNKTENKMYYKHSGYPGGLKIIKFKHMMLKDPTFIIKNAIKGMLPKNKLQKVLLKRLKIYPNSNHPHVAQNAKLTNI